MPFAVPDKRALVLRLKHPEKIEAVLPRSQRLDDHTLAVPHRTKEFIVLKNAGVKVEGFEPIRTHYDWPMLAGTKAPMPHQRATAEFSSTHPRGYIFNEQRTGKTASLVWAIDFLRRDRAVRSILVSCTMSTMRSVWMNEIFSIAPHLTVGILHGSRRDRLRVLAEPYDVYVINHHGVNVIGSELAAAIPGRINAVLLDEATRYANHTTDLHKAALPICAAAEFCWALTGTPLARGADKAYGLAKLVTPNTMPHLPDTWKTMVMSPFQIIVEHPKSKRPMTVTKYRPRHDAAALASAVLTPAIRFEKRKVLKDLPPVTHQTLDLEPTTEQRRVIRELKNKKGAIVEASILTVANAGVLANKIRQVCGGAAIGANGEPVRIDVTNKLDATIELIEGTSNKVVIFSNYQVVTDLIVEALQRRKIGTVWVDGRVTGRKRDRAVDAFQHDDRVKVLVAHPETTAHGLEFAVADTTIWWTLTEDKELYLQANERMASAAQKNPMGIYYLFAHPVERAAYRALVDGTSVQKAFFEAVKLWNQERGGS